MSVTLKFTVTRKGGGSAHAIEIVARPWTERSAVPREVAADRAWTIGCQRFQKDNWPAKLTGAKLDTELHRLANVFEYGGASTAPVSAAAAGVRESDTVAEALAKLRAAGVNITI